MPDRTADVTCTRPQKCALCPKTLCNLYFAHRGGCPQAPASQQGRLRKLGDDTKTDVDPSALQKNAFEQRLVVEMAAVSGGVGSIWSSADKAALIATTAPTVSLSGGAGGGAGVGSSGVGGASASVGATDAAGGGSVAGGVDANEIVVCGACSTLLWNKAVEEWRWAADASLVPAHAQGRPDCWCVLVVLMTLLVFVIHALRYRAYQLQHGSSWQFSTEDSLPHVLLSAVTCAVSRFSSPSACNFFLNNYVVYAVKYLASELTLLRFCGWVVFVSVFFSLRYGKECRTQTHNAGHQQRYNHICERSSR